MGQLKSDGKATQGGWTWPAGTIKFGEMYRLNGWNGIALKAIAAGDTVRTADMEISSERIWYCKLPSGVTGARGTYLYWPIAALATFEVGETDLSETVHGSPVAIVEEAKDANGYAGIRVLNVGPGATS